MPDRPSDEQRNAATFSALAVVLLVAVGLLGMVALVLPQVLGFVAVVVAMGFFGVLHYVIWGRWLSAKLRKDSDSDETRMS